jgi:hypothetical protein
MHRTAPIPRPPELTVHASAQQTRQTACT